jgi:UTP--glucose-1-phosphate uridylyltransferase
VGCAERLVGNEPFLLLLADDLLLGTAEAGAVCQQLVAQFRAHACSVIATEDVPREDTHRYGIVGGVHLATDYRLTQVQALVEKPAPADAPSTQAIVGRYLLTPRVFHHIRHLTPGKNGELQLTDALVSLMKEERLLAYRYQGKRFDCGSKLGYLQATVEHALAHPELSRTFRQYLLQLCRNLPRPPAGKGKGKGKGKTRLRANPPGSTARSPGRARSRARPGKT